MSGSYVLISALIFAVVACVHLLRIAKGWPAQVGPHTVPMSLSWIGLVVSALLAVWGFMQLGH